MTKEQDLIIVQNYAIMRLLHALVETQEPGSPTDEFSNFLKKAFEKSENHIKESKILET